MEVLQESLSRLEHQMVVVSHWQQSIMSQLKRHLDLLHLTNVAAGPSNVKVANWIKVIQAAEQTHRNECDKLFQKVSGIVFWLLFSLIVSSLFDILSNVWVWFISLLTKERFCVISVYVLMIIIMFAVHFLCGRDPRNLNHGYTVINYISVPPKCQTNERKS